MLRFLENRALVDVKIKIFIAYLFKGSQEQSFFLQALLFTAFLVTVLKILTDAHDPWSAQNGSKSNEKCTPVTKCFLGLILSSRVGQEESFFILIMEKIKLFCV